MLKARIDGDILHRDLRYARSDAPAKAWDKPTESVLPIAHGAYAFLERSSNGELRSRPFIPGNIGCRVIIEPTTALCSFYAEAGGMMIGFEGGYNTENNNKDL